jgi:ABC-2 type transport system permease protein
MPIRDLGYKPYEGRLLPHRSRYRVLIARTLALAWASGLVKATLIVSLFPMIVCGVIIFIKVKAQQMLAAQGAPIQIDDPDVWVFNCIFWCQIWFAFALSLRVGATAIADDVRTGAFQFYFARPVSRAHYLVGKAVPLALLVLVVTAGPGLLLAVLRLGLSQDAGDAWGRLPLLLGTLAYAPIYAALLALPPLALSTLSRNAGGVQGLWAAVFFFSWVLGDGMAAATGVPAAALLSLPTNLMLVGQHLYGLEPAYPIAWTYPAGVILLVVGGSVALLLHRLGRVEVFA